MKKILVTGATGQIGSELIPVLREKYGNENVVATVYKKPLDEEILNSGPYEFIDATNKVALKQVIENHEINIIYHLAGVLSAAGEKNPQLAWDVNINGLKNVLDLSVKHHIKQVFWPSSIAAFGPTTPRQNTPQETIIEPTTMYGITKRAGELLCLYYHNTYNLDVRGLRYPGLISYKTEPGGGTTDYAVDIFYHAVQHRPYTCFVSRDTMLPMMYMDDAIRGTIEIMQVPANKITVWTNYNFAALSFTAEELAEEIKKYIKDFTVEYKPDFRQDIANSWPQSIDDSRAREDWEWRHEFDLEKMTKVMLDKVGEKFSK